MLYPYMLWLTPLWSLLPGSVPVLIGARLLLKYCITGAMSIPAVLSHTGVPTMAAAAVWRYGHTYPRFFLLFLPFVSSVTFIASVGLNAHAWFSVFWLALPALYAVSVTNRSHILVRALVASLTAHMIGTLIVLFLGAPVSWVSLVPLVPFERVVAASGMVLVFGAIAFCRQLLRRVANFYTSSIE